MFLCLRTYICMHGNPSLQVQSDYLVIVELSLSFTLTHERTDCMFADIKSVVYYSGHI